MSLVNLMAEIEHRMSGSSRAPRLDANLAAAIPAADTYVVVLFDGLGAHQLSNSNAKDLASDQVGTIDAMFPSTTTVSLASVATAMTPTEHGIFAYLMNFPEHGIVNMLKWMRPGSGETIAASTADLLPSPNLWERLTTHGLEAICVQPGDFAQSPLTRALYRGARYESVWTENEIVDATVQLAKEPGRLIFTYVPHVDVAAHIAGQDSAEYARAMQTANNIWASISARLPEGAVAVGTADHGHIDYTHDKKLSLPTDGLTIFGEPRAVYVRVDGESDPVTTCPPQLAHLPATWVPVAEMRAWFGPGTPHPALEDRLPHGVLLPDPGYLLLTGYMDGRLIGMHGGLEPAELEIPVLVTPQNPTN